MQPVSQFEPTQKAVYRAAVQLSRLAPDGFDATQLAGKLGCPLDEARRWLAWLRQTGDFASRRELEQKG